MLDLHRYCEHCAASEPFIYGEPTPMHCGAPMALYDGCQGIREPVAGRWVYAGTPPGPWHRFIGSGPGGFYWFSLVDGFALRDPAPARAGDSTASGVGV